MIFARFLPNSAFLIKKSCSKLVTWWGGGGRGGGGGGSVSASSFG